LFYYVTCNKRGAQEALLTDPEQHYACMAVHLAGTEKVGKKLINFKRKFRLKRPLKGISLSQTMWLAVPNIEIHQRVPENGRDKK
jgi:hypothetical protein